MMAIYAVASPDRGLAWLIYALLAFLLISVVVGAIAGQKVFDQRAPGALHDTEGAAPQGAAPGR